MRRPEPSPPRTSPSGARPALAQAATSRWLVPAALAVALVAAGAAWAEPVLEVGGSVVTTTPRLQVSVVITNRGDRAVSSLEIVGELLGQRQETRISRGVAAGERGTVVLDFDAGGARPGVYALVLLLEYPIEGAPDAAGNPPLASRRAWLLVTLGPRPAPAVRLEPKQALLAVTGRLGIVVGSADGAAHRVRLRAYTPRGLRSDGDGVEIEVPAQGVVIADLPLVRAGAPRGTQHPVLVVAETVGGPFAQTSVATATVHVAADPARLPRWRVRILVLACFLLGIAGGAELWIRLRGRSRGPSVAT